MIGSFFKGLSGLITGPKSPGRPSSLIASADEVVEESATLAAFRQDVIRRNAMRRSSTTGTGADFVKKMQGQDVFADIPIPGYEEDAPSTTETQDPVKPPPVRSQSALRGGKQRWQKQQADYQNYLKTRNGI